MIVIIFNLLIIEEKRQSSNHDSDKGNQISKIGKQKFLSNHLKKIKGGKLTLMMNENMPYKLNLQFYHRTTPSFDEAHIV
jgi:hypothetical protein